MLVNSQTLTCTGNIAGTGLYATSGTDASVMLNQTGGAHNAGIYMQFQGTTMWYMGKDPDHSFSIWDSHLNNNILRCAYGSNSVWSDKNFGAPNVSAGTTLVLRSLTVQYESAHIVNTTSHMYIINLCDSNGNNGAADTLYIRGLTNGGATDVPLASMLVNSQTLTCTGNITAYSDLRLKTDIVTIKNALDRITNLVGVEYTRIQNGAREMGLIAQDVEKFEPTLVHYDQVTNEEPDPIRSLKYMNTVALLIEAVKELNTKVDNLVLGVK
jgi:hypothetical protein